MAVRGALPTVAAPNEAQWGSGISPMLPLTAQSPGIPNARQCSPPPPSASGSRVKPVPGVGSADGRLQLSVASPASTQLQQRETLGAASPLQRDALSRGGLNRFSTSGQLNLQRSAGSPVRQLSVQASSAVALRQTSSPRHDLRRCPSPRAELTRSTSKAKMPTADTQTMSSAPSMLPAPMTPGGYGSSRDDALAFSGAHWPPPSVCAAPPLSSHILAQAAAAASREDVHLSDAMSHVPLSGMTVVASASVMPSLGQPGPPYSTTSGNLPQQQELLVQLAAVRLELESQWRKWQQRDQQAAAAFEAEVQELRVGLDCQRDQQEARLASLRGEVRSLEQQLLTQQGRALQEATLGSANLAERIASEVNALRQEFLASQAVHANAWAQEAATIRKDLSQELRNQIKSEQEARQSETGELRSLLRVVHDRLENTCDNLGRIHAAVEAATQPDALCESLFSHTEVARLVETLHQVSATSASGDGADMKELTELRIRNDALDKEIQLEVEQRVSGVAELHAMLAREIAGVGLRVEARSMEIEKAVFKEVDKRTTDSKELRVTMDTILQAQSQTEAERNVKSDDSSSSPDLNTIYEMLQQAQHDSAHLSNELNEERANRSQKAQEAQRTAQLLQRLELQAARAEAVPAPEMRLLELREELALREASLRQEVGQRLLELTEAMEKMSLKSRDRASTPATSVSRGRSSERRRESTPSGHSLEDVVRLTNTITLGVQDLNRRFTYEQANRQATDQRLEALIQELAGTAVVESPLNPLSVSAVSTLSPSPR